jgi:hypothetical protein
MCKNEPTYSSTNKHNVDWVQGIIMDMLVNTYIGGQSHIRLDSCETSC